MPAAHINIRVDSDIKNEAQEIFASLGLDMTSAITVFLRQSIRRKGLPFAVTSAHSPKTPHPDSMKGRIWMSDDFDAPLEDFREYME
jgi:DNA-damage-inducible protein J